jgi:hypothetical protein
MGRVQDQVWAYLLDENGGYVLDEEGELTAATTVEAELQRRLRIGTAEDAITDANLYDVMAKAQHMMNYGMKRVISTGTFNASSNTSIYVFNASGTLSSQCYQVLSLYDASRTILKLPNWKHIAQYNKGWYITADATESRAEVWAPISNNLLAIYPAKSSSDSYSAVYLKECTFASTGSTGTLEIPNEDVTVLYDVCEIVFLMHLRLYEEVARKVEMLAKDIGLTLTGEKQ